MSDDSNNLDKPIAETQISPKIETKQIHRLTGTIFLIGITSIFLISGFSSTLLALKRKSPKYFNEYSTNHEKNGDPGTMLALRALGWGSFYSTLGCSILFYSIWKLSGAKSFEEFQQKMQKTLPKISKNNSLS